jgi:glycosyltransferase involved in cell wall biosynthesis
MQEKTKLVSAISYMAPNYIRGRNLLDALQNNQTINVYEAHNTNTGLLRYVQTFLKLLKIKKDVDPEIWLVNFRGHEIYWLIRMLSGKKNRIIFDEFVSPYDSFVNERRSLKKDSLLAKLVYSVEKSILDDADFIITDTPSQVNYITSLFDIPGEKLSFVNMSTDENLFTVTGTKKKYEFPEPFVVFSYATFLPLHGMDIILEAANLVKDLPIHFYIAGGRGKTLQTFLEKKKMLALDKFDHTQWIEYTDLPAYIRGADVCLGGPFGNTGQGLRVVTGKTLQFLACARPTVIGQGDEDYGFEDRNNCLLVPQGDPAQLADALRWAFEHQSALHGIGLNGRAMYEEKFSSAAVKTSLDKLIVEVQHALRNGRTNDPFKSAKGG